MNGITISRAFKVQESFLAAKLTSVVIVNWNGERFLPSLLQSIRGEDPAEIIVIDNASSDGSVGYLRNQSGVRTIENSDNVGFGSAANQGLQSSTTPFVLLLNVDTQAVRGSIRKLETFLDQNATAGMVAPQLLFPDGTLQPSCRNLPTPWNYSLFLSYLDYFIPAGYRISKRKHSQMMQVEQPMGAVLMIRRSALDATGFFDPQFTLYMEEIDLCKRMKEAAWKIYYLPDAKFIHHAGGSTSQDWERTQTDYFANVIRYFKKHFPDKRVKPSLSAALVLRSFVLFIAGRFHQSKFYFKQAFNL